MVSLHGVRRVKCHGQNMNSEWYGRSKDFYKKSQSRLEALILMKCSIYLLQVIKSCDVKCPEADTRLHLKNLLQHVAESVSKRLKSKVSENDQTFQFLFKNHQNQLILFYHRWKRNWVKDSNEGHRQCTFPIILIWVSLLNKCTFWYWKVRQWLKHYTIFFKVYSFVSLQSYN